MRTTCAVQKITSLDKDDRLRGWTKPRVCVSVPVFEEPRYVEALIANFKHYLDWDTRIVLHLGSETNYSYDLPKKWEESNRIGITKQRIKVDAFKGSVFWSHMLNAKTMESLWPGHCEFFLMQASNQWWVRSGVEDVVRTYQYADFFIQSESKPSCMAQDRFYNEKLYKGPRGGIHSWGVPEGSFFPMRLVNEFVHLAASWLSTNGLTESYFADADCYFEASYLQVYAQNWYEPAPPPRTELPGSLCYRHFVTGKAEDAVPIEDIQKVMLAVDDEHEKWSSYYSVKRIARNMTNPTTKFVEALSARYRIAGGAEPVIDWRTAQGESEIKKEPVLDWRNR